MKVKKPHKATLVRNSSPFFKCMPPLMPCGATIAISFEGPFFFELMTTLNSLTVSLGLCNSGANSVHADFERTAECREGNHYRHHQGV
ncbi:hypothetical protein CEXT_580761 [Caerostris extrusa]|uniref:Uncharacterized protein n=1 Tax=Caerostris extrusa TaxID=172846 RepID=A0AAV4V184_CAEEX|nr:hypothetical protein CEXT_580761 [Caerostris extrusa]